MLSHADKYSGAFNRAIYEKLQAGEKVEDAWKYSSFWYKDFEAMAFKTMLRQLISKWGIMSTEMSDAFVKDGMAANSENGDFDYIDSTSEPITANDQTIHGEDQSNVVNEFCTAEQFAEIRRKYFDHVANKKITPEKLIADMGKKHALTDDQQSEILNWGEANV
jgi:recombinational DNA repair protein RecT